MKHLEFGYDGNMAETRNPLERFKPASSAHTQIILAAMMWSTVGSVLLLVGGWWAFHPPEALLVVLMAGGGRLLRSGPIPRFWIGLLYAGVGAGLFRSSLVFWKFSRKQSFDRE